MAIEKERIAWLTSARDEAAVDLLQSIVEAGIEPAVVVSAIDSKSRFVTEIARLCHDFNIPNVQFEHAPIDSELDAIRAALGSLNDEQLRDLLVSEQRVRTREERLWQSINEYKCKTLVMIGYMWMVTPVLLSKANILNLHPAPPFGPTGTWQEVMWSLISIRARLAGGMLHIATMRKDRGPVISYYTVSLDDDELAPMWSNFADKLRTRSLQLIKQEDGEREPLFTAVRERQFVREAPLLIVTLRYILDGRLRIANGGVAMNGTLLRDGACLNAEVEAVIRGHAS